MPVRRRAALAIALLLAMLAPVVPAAAQSLPPPFDDQLARVQAAFGSCSGDGNFDATVDFNADGCIDLIDFSILSARYRHRGGA